MHGSIKRMNHPNLVVVHYNKYAGGKFFINCLAHHDQVLPGLSVAAPVYTYDHWIFESWIPSKTQKKISRINQTILDPQHLHEWAKAELGCNQFWGWGLGELWSQPVQTNNYSLSLLNDHRCFIVNHDMDSDHYHKICNMWPQAQHIILYNEKQFQQRAVTLKSPDAVQLRTAALPRNLPAFYFDVDGNQFNRSAIIKITEQCLAWMGLDTRMHDNINNYVERYFAIHQ